MRPVSSPITTASPINDGRPKVDCCGRARSYSLRGAARLLSLPSVCDRENMLHVRLAFLRSSLKLRKRQSNSSRSASVACVYARFPGECVYRTLEPHLPAAWPRTLEPRTVTAGHTPRGRIHQAPHKNAQNSPRLLAGVGISISVERRDFGPVRRVQAVQRRSRGGGLYYCSDECRRLRKNEVARAWRARTPEHQEEYSRSRREGPFPKDCVVCGKSFLGGAADDSGAVSRLHACASVCASWSVDACAVEGRVVIQPLFLAESRGVRWLAQAGAAAGHPLQAPRWRDTGSAVAGEN